MTSRTKTILAGAALAAVLALGQPGHAADAIPTKAEPGTLKMGIEPWLGYGQWYVAAKKGIFEQQGLSKVDIVNFTEDKDINAALASGQVDAANIATHTAMGMIAAGLPVKAVMLLDFSLTADAIIAGKDVKTVADLKGKNVAFEQGTTSDILLNYALAQNGMTIADVKPVPMPAADAGSALLAGRVPVAVTYEPYIAAARKQDPNVNLVYTAGKDPGLVSDVLVVTDDAIKNKPGQVLALVRSWGEALKAYDADKTAGRKVIAEGVGSSPEELASAFDGVKYYSLEENKQSFNVDFRTKTFDDVLKAARKAGLVTKDVTAAEMLDPDFVAAAK